MSKSTDEWVLIDTETTGIIDPIYILEIYAQQMEGFKPKGEPLHIYLNHGVPIPQEATAIHGYTNKFIEKVGISPKKAHLSLEEYSKGLPICSHNLGYDWCRCLLPERRRLDLKPALAKGFCTLQLFRRALEFHESYKLTSLKDKYGINHPDDCPSHSAKGDVLTVLEILDKEIAPILASNEISTVKAITDFTKLTPISLCRQKLGLTTNQKGYKEDLNKPLEQIVLETLAETLDLTEIEDRRIQELDAWLSKGTKVNPILSKEVSKIVSQGIIEPDQRIEMLEMIQPMLPLKEKASQKQKNYLRKLGADFNERITKVEASKLIDKIKGEKIKPQKGLITID
jgi:DNA polymerase III epsilon subunit-like protein